MTFRQFSFVAPLILASVFCGQATASPRDPTLPDWIRIADRNPGGLTRGQAIAALQDWRRSERQRVMTLRLENGDGSPLSWRITRGELGGDPDVAAMVDEAFRITEQETFMERVNRWFGRGELVHVGPVWRVDGEALRRCLTRTVAPKVERKPVDARVTLQKGRLVVTPHKDGLALDLARSVEDCKGALLNPAADTARVYVRVEPASVPAEAAAGIGTRIGYFETSYKERGNRRKNIERACALLNGAVIMPGEVLSFNKLVGPRTVANGFRVAPEIVRGRMVPGVGGGVCQVSTTLYNAALLAGLAVVARSHHAFPVRYVPPGQDATVAYGSIDLKLRNATDGPIAVLADGTGGKVRISIYGTAAPTRTARIERTDMSSWGPPVKTVKDASLPVGKTIVRESGHAGHRVNVWRVYEKGGKVVLRERVSSDVYRAFPRIVAIGTRPSAPGGAPGATNGIIKPPLEIGSPPSTP